MWIECTAAGGEAVRRNWIDMRARGRAKVNEREAAASCRFAQKEKLGHQAAIIKGKQMGISSNERKWLW